MEMTDLGQRKIVVTYPNGKVETYYPGHEPVVSMLAGVTMYSWHDEESGRIVCLNVVLSSIASVEHFHRPEEVAPELYARIEQNRQRERKARQDAVSKEGGSS